MTHAETVDPTSSATPCPAQPTTTTLLSRNEIETLCLKAARGAGMDWGLAEEAGIAAGWLAVRGIDGAGALLAHLQRPVPCIIAVRDRHWQATGGAALCPILLGAALDDHAALEAGPWSAPITIKAVSHPILLVPFLARAAQIRVKSLGLAWSGGVAKILASGEVEPTALAALSGLEVTALSLSATSDTARHTAIETAIASLSAATLAGLNTLALRTTVPASDTSRRGAGAAASDND